MILLTGGTGFLGQRVLKKLLERGEDDIRCFVRLETKDNVFEKFIDESVNVKLELFKGRFSNPDDWKKSLEGVDKVIHLASLKTGSVPVQINNNVVYSEYLFKESALLADIKRFVLCSSLGVVKASSVSKGGLVDENCQIDDKPELRDAYSHSKIVQENLAWKYYNENNLPLVVMRPSVVFGPPDSILTPRIGINMFNFFFYLGGSNIMPITYKDNCADAIVLSAYAKNIKGEVFHITDDNLPTSREIMNLYKKKVKSIKTIPLPYPMLRLGSKLNQVYSERTYDHIPAVFTPYKVDTMWKGHSYSNKKAKELLGWSPHVSMKDALNKTLLSEKEMLSRK